MRIWRFDFGRATGDPVYSFFVKSLCGCCLADVGPYYFTYLGDSCYAIIRNGVLR